MQIISTGDVITQCGHYHSSAKEFFRLFPKAWDEVSETVRKLETKQFYQEPDNESFQALQQGNFQKALSLIEKDRSQGSDLYQSLTQKGVNFIRCRPLVKPLSEYMKWELEVYKVNARYGEQIYITEDLGPFKERALHDFMVFDHFFAVIHNYDEKGLIQGGWSITNPTGIKTLVDIFEEIMSVSQKQEADSLMPH